MSSVQTGLASSRAVFLSCMNSPSTRFATTVARSSMTSASRNLAKATDALPSKKSPAKTAILLPNDRFAEGEDRRETELSMTSSWSNEAVCISSVISASRLCDGKMSESSEVYAASSEEVESGLAAGIERLTSDKTLEGDIGLSIVEDDGDEGFRETLGVKAVALDMSRTSRGRICFPSEFV